MLGVLRFGKQGEGTGTVQMQVQAGYCWGQTGY